MENSPLAKLPGEIRNRIYEYALQHQYPFELERKGHRGEDTGLLQMPFWFMPPEHFLALPATCKLIRAESLGIFFAVNTFKIHCNGQRDIRARLRDLRTHIVGPEHNHDLSIVIMTRSCYLPREPEFATIVVHEILDAFYDILATRDRVIPRARCKLIFGVNFNDGNYILQRQLEEVLELEFDHEDMEASWDAVKQRLDRSLCSRGICDSEILALGDN